MNVLNPANASHLLRIIPRFYPEGEVTLILANEGKPETITMQIDPLIQDGYLSVTFNYEFVNNSNYKVTITHSDEIVYRGKVFVTSQASNTQQYQISNDIFIYGD